MRPKAIYTQSLELLKRAKALSPRTPTKSGLMVGLGETRDELLSVFADLRASDVDVLTVGQYLRPTLRHLPVERHVHARRVRGLQARRAGHGLSARRERAAGAFELPRTRPATIAPPVRAFDY